MIFPIPLGGFLPRHGLALGLLVFACVGSLWAQVLDSSSVVSFWRLDGNTADSVGSNAGTFVGTANFVAGPRSDTQAANLSGGSYVRCGTNFSFDRTTPFSVTTWVKGDSANNDSTLVGKMLQGNGYTGWELHVGSPSGAGRLNVWLINNYGANYIEVQSPTLVLDSAWHHVGFTSDGSGRAAGVRIYVDGVDATGVISADSLTGTLRNTVELDLGTRQNGANHNFTGALAEAAVWNTCLTAANLLNIFRNGIPPPSSDPVTFLQQPQPQSVPEQSSVTFMAQAVGAWPITYQWLRNGAPIIGATNRVLTFIATVPDDGAQFALAATNRVTNTVYGAISSNAPLTVLADTNPPLLLRAQGLALAGAQLRFSEPLRLETATNRANYSIASTNGAITITNATLSADGATVTLYTTPQTLGVTYTVTVTGVKDRAYAANPVSPGSQAQFVALPFSTTDIGGDAAAGSLTYADGAYLLTAAGGGTLGTNDQLAFSSQPRSGDFDVRVRVLGLTVADVWSRASLLAREDTSANGRFVAAVATPTLAGCFLEWRGSLGAAFQRAGSYPPNMPLWLRLKRSGNTFSAFAGMEGTAWFRLGDATVTLSNNVLLGFGVASGAANPVTARLADFSANTSTNGAPLPDLEPPGPSSRHTAIAITEIHYSPAPRADAKDLEFVELFNSNPWPEDIGGWRLSGDIDFAFPPGTAMPGGGYFVVANAPGDCMAVYGLSNVFGPYGNRLKATGTLRLRNEHDAVMLEVNYRNKSPWPVAPDGTGHSLVLKRPSYGENDPRAWGASENLGGSPGAFDNLSANPLRGVVINEILANGTNDFIELYNHTTATVDLSGCTLSDRVNTNRFTVPPGATLGSGQFISFDRAVLGFGLEFEGGNIFLREPSGRVLDAVAYGPQEAGVAFGRSPDGALAFRRLAMPTPGTSNAAVRTEPVVINEIMYSSVTGVDDDQFVELFNQGTSAVDLTGWRFTDGIDFTFPSNTMLAASGYLVVARNLTNLLAKYTNLTAGNTLGNFSGKLSGAGEPVALAKPTLDRGTNALGQWVTNTIWIDVAEVTYASGGRWPHWANGGGSSLELIDSRADATQPANWADSNESGKSAWTIAEATGYLDLGTTYQSTPIDRLELTALGAGEWLVDDVEVRQKNGPNLIANSSFETGLGAWVPQGNHVRSTLSASGLGYGGGRALQVRANADGDTGANRIRVPLTSALTPGQVCTIRAKVRWLAGFPELAMRVKGNYHELFVRCNVPANLGTPGLRNSRAVTNAGPAIYDVAYTPVLPVANEPVVVTARVHDPDGVNTFRIRYRTDPSTAYSVVNFHDDGLSGDAVANDGVFSATLPGKAAGTLVTFYAEATDRATSAVTSHFPADAPTNECLVRVGEPALSGSFGAYRLWLTTSNVNRWINRPFLDNEPLPGTLVVGNFRAIQFAEGNYAGSAARPASPSPVTGPADFTFDVPPDDRLLGSEALQKLRNPGSAPVAEPLSYLFSRQLGMPWMNFRLVAWFVNGNRQGLLLQDMETPNGDVVKSRFPNDNQGQLYKNVIRYEFDDVTATGGSAAGFQWFGGVSHGAATLNNYLTPNVTTGLPERKIAVWRRTFLPRGSRTTANDYTNLFALIDAAANASSPQLRALVNFDEWARHCAVDHMTADWDSFAAENGQNMYFYKDTGTTWHWLPFDRNIVFSGSTSYDLFIGHTYFPDPPFNAAEAQPDFRRFWWTAYQELAARWMAPEFFHPWLDARSAAFKNAGVGAASSDGLKSWIATRRSFIQQALGSVDVPFTSVTNFIATETNQVLLSGTAVPWFESLTANGRPLALQWTSVTNWVALVTVRAGTNVLNLAGLDRAGAPISNAGVQVIIVFTGTNAWPPLRINEWMADNTGFIRDPADNNKDDWFELYNPTAAPVDLAEWSLTDTPANPARFLVPGGYAVPANGFLLCWADGEPQQNATNRPDLHVSFKLEKNGECIALYAPDGTLVDSVVFGPQTANFSQGRYPDGSATIGPLALPTPRSPNAPPPLPPGFLNIVTSGTNVTLTLQSTPAFTYQIEFKDDLAFPAWTPLGIALTASTNLLTVTDSLLGTAQRFYRVWRSP